MADELVRSLIAQASASIESGQYVQALDFADQALAMEPENGEAHLARAITLSRTGQNDLATAAFRAATNYWPSSGEPNYRLAMHFRANGMGRESMETARRALEIEPGHAGARELLAQVERELGVAAPPSSEIPVAAYAPPNAEGGQYQQNPYTEQGGAYYRPGQASWDGRMHNVAFVEKMGKNWDTFGLVLAIFGAAMTVYGIINMVQNWDAMMTAIQAGKQADIPQNIVMQILSWVGLIASIFWVASDIADRKGNWLWLVVFLICCCCNPVQWLYYFLGRKNN